MSWIGYLALLIIIIYLEELMLLSVDEDRLLSLPVPAVLTEGK